MGFSFTEGGRRKLIRNEYQYVKQKNLANGLTSWMCIEHRKGNCKVKAKLDAINDFLEEVQEHTHVLCFTRYELTKVRANITRKASNTQDTTHQILNTELANLTPTASVNLRNLSNLRQNIRRQRQEKIILSVPQRKEDYASVTHEYRMTGTGERFLLFDSGLGDINRMFLFPTNNGKGFIANSSQWFGDGTFKLCPQVFSQIYTIHVLVNHEVFIVFLNF